MKRGTHLEFLHEFLIIFVKTTISPKNILNKFKKLILNYEGKQIFNTYLVAFFRLCLSAPLAATPPSLSGVAFTQEVQPNGVATPPPPPPSFSPTFVKTRPLLRLSGWRRGRRKGEPLVTSRQKDLEIREARALITEK